MKITEKQIHEISQDLQIGLKTFINRKTYEIKSILDPNDIYSDLEIWEEELEEIKDNRLKDNFIKILNRKSPFANFKAEIESSEYRQKWFDFRDFKYEVYVKGKLKEEQIKIE